ncbi:MAG: hypothetical protein KAX57_00980 [Rhodoferax sp.]|jgi:hypothetical protein|uniref:host specificity factor TipJ family phage tail protein n=1 Tax=Rhodoferax sp. TaxID=50421 RepID=UPI001B5985FE|nr:host specificity factor TipJ family phage tail protein [Rhodoferax sp.]MBP8285392.1 hypothetical protein [Rhodoferax sp.]MBP9148714.1 hypothetical protein [Rhodoferax sp.]MBP9736252.1 hypothetical protein [Rhodoferax sp.]
MKITLYAHPFAGAAPQHFEASSLVEWLLDHYGPSPDVRVQVFAGEPSAETEITTDLAAMLRGDAPAYTVLQSPAGFDPITWLIIAVVASVAMLVLMPKPEMPGNVNRTQASPNNALSARENKVRMLERVEDIYGTVKSIPSLMMPTYNKYINHKKYEYGYYCVGRGYHFLNDIKDGDTLIADIDGARAAVYSPFTSPNYGTPYVSVGSAITDKIITASRAIEVDGITLKAPNQINLPASGVYTFTPDVSGGTITQVAKNPNFNSVCDVGDTLVVTMPPTGQVISTGIDYDGTPINTAAITVVGATRQLTDVSGYGVFDTVTVGDTLTLSGFYSSSNNGTFTIATKTNDYVVTLSGGSMVNEIATAVTVSVVRNYSGSYTILTVDDGWVRLTPASTSAWTSIAKNITCAVINTSATEYTAWVTLPDLDRTQIWINLVAPNGIFFDQGGSKTSQTIGYDVIIEKLNPTTLAPLSIFQEIHNTISGSVSDERAITIEHTTAWVGPARVCMRRNSNYPFGANGTVADEIKWADLYSVSPVTKLEFGNKTTIHTVTQATARATSVKTRQLNCIASRHLPTFNGSVWSGSFDATGRMASGSIHPTSKLVDIIAAVSQDPKIGARSLSEVDVAQIWAVQQELDAWGAFTGGPSMGQFNYTFDSDNTSYEEALIMISNAGFCVAYRQNGKIRLALDKLQTSSAALFTHRNKKPNSESITRRFASDADYDGVEFVFVDPDTNTSESINLPLDGSATKVKKFEIAGIRNYTQAWYRANREYAKLRGQRISLDTTTTLDARSLLPNARIDVVDNTRFKSFDGEVVGQSGLTLTLSQPVEFTGGSHSIILMRRDGSLQSIACTAGSDPYQVVLAGYPTESIVTSYGAAGVRTIFSFGNDSARAAQSYLVQEIDITDKQYAAIKAINYSADYYSADVLSVPAKASVIN